MVWKKDFLWGLIFLIISVSAYIYSYSLPVIGATHPLAGTGLYVRFIMVIFGFLACSLMLKAWMKKNSEKTAVIFDPIVLFSLIILVLYVIVMPVLGYLIATTLFLVITVTAYQLYQYQKENWPKGKPLLFMVLKNLVISLLMTVVLREIFVGILAVRLP